MDTTNKLERMYPITEVCKDCGAEFTVSVKEQLFAKENKGFCLPKRCRDCRIKRKEQSKQIICVECGEVFEFTANEQSFFAKNGLKDPKRCKNCRGMNNGQNIAKEDKQG